MPHHYVKVPNYINPNTLSLKKIGYPYLFMYLVEFFTICIQLYVTYNLLLLQQFYNAKMKL